MKHFFDIKNLLTLNKTADPSSTAKNPVQLKSTHLKGIDGENLAAQKIEDEGFTIITRNYKTSLGEIDIVAQKGEDVYFFEVKSRFTSFFDPLENISKRKQQRVRNVAKCFLKSRFRNKPWPPVQFGAVSVDMSTTPAKVELLIGVF